MKIRKLNEDRQKVVVEMRAILTKTEAEKRHMNAEEQQKYDELYESQENLKRQIENETRQAELEHEMNVTRDFGSSSEKTEGKEGSTPDAQTRAFRNFLLNGYQSLSSQEQRDLTAGNHVEGGAIVAPKQWVMELLKAVDNLSVIRGMATVHTLVKAVSLGVPTLDSDPSDADWTPEVGTGSDDTEMKFGSRELNPNALAKRIKVSNKLIRSSALPVEDIVRDRLAYKFNITEEKHFMIGHGANQPLGLFTASNNGISTSRDVVGSNTTTAIVADTLIDTKFAVKEAYQNVGSWLFHRDAVKMVSKLKDSQNQYLWQPGLQAGKPDTLLGRPIVQSEYVPNTFTTAKYVGLFGDFKQYWIADSLEVTIQKLVELYAESNKTGYIGRKETDGAPVLQEAFARIKLG